MQIIEDAFNTMKEREGLKSTEELVDAYVKAEDQNQSLYLYLNRLNQEADFLEENNAETHLDIQRFRERVSLDSSTLHEHVEDLQAHVQHLRLQIGGRNARQSRFKQDLAAMQGRVHGMVELFKRARFGTLVSQVNRYDDWESFNEDNVVQFLGELEDYISQLGAMQAARRKEKDPAHVSFVDVQPKQFKKKEETIEAPQSAADVLQPPSGASPTRTISSQPPKSNNEAPDTPVVNGRALYQRFME